MLDTQKLLQLYAERLYGPWILRADAKAAVDAEESQLPETEVGEAVAEVGEPVVAASAVEEPAAADDALPAAVRVLPRGRFSLASMGGIEGLAFVACNDPFVDPNATCAAVFADIRDDRLPAPLSPHLYRMLPIVYTASTASLGTVVPPPSFPLLPSALASPFTFSVVFRHSNASATNVDRAGAIRALAVRVEEEAKRRGLVCGVQLQGSDVTLLCWLVKSVACIAVMQAYHHWHHFNVAELAKTADERRKQQHAAVAASVAASAAADVVG